MLHKYENVYLELNKELRTDNENVVHLQENVPSLFKLSDRYCKIHFAFCVDFEVNPKGTVSVTFESSSPVEVYLSTEATKPDKQRCQKALASSGKFTPPEIDGKLQNAEQSQYIYGTVMALKDRSHGKIMIKTDPMQNFGGSKKVRLSKRM